MGVRIDGVTRSTCAHVDGAPRAISVDGASRCGLAGWATRAITEVADFGTGAFLSNADADARVYVGDLSGFGAAYAGVTLAVMNGGVLDVVQTAAGPEPIEYGPLQGFLNGDQVISRPAFPAQVTHFRIAHVSGPVPGQDGSSTWTYGQWIARGTHVWIRAGVLLGAMTAGPDPGDEIDSHILVEFRYASGAVLSAPVRLYITTYDITAIPP